jgi:hypothetical protein
MEVEKLIGWLTFLAGILIIIFTLYASYNIFTAKIPVPQFFETGGESLSLSESQTPTTPAELQEQMGKIMGEQLLKLFPEDTIINLLNLAVWSILTGILIFGGSHIANLGVKLIKK